MVPRREGLPLANSARTLAAAILPILFGTAIADSPSFAGRWSG
jgi:hypothetical protein